MKGNRAQAGLQLLEESKKAGRVPGGHGNSFGVRHPDEQGPQDGPTAAEEEERAGGAAHEFALEISPESDGEKRSSQHHHQEQAREQKAITQCGQPSEAPAQRGRPPANPDFHVPHQPIELLARHGRSARVSEGAVTRCTR